MKKLLYIFYGFLLGGLIVYVVNRQFQTRSTTNESHVISYEIKKLNKMIVAEQAFSDIYTHKNSRFFPGLENYFSFDKKVLLMVNAKVQATYDMTKLEIEVDSKKEIIYIKKVPKLEIKTYPDIQFYDLEQSRFNSFSKDELNTVKDEAVKHIEKSIDKKQLEKEAHDQLIDNLGNLYMLAKAYNWKVVDKTPYATELNQMFN